jgi:prophage maintenance system killer protein
MAMFTFLQLNALEPIAKESDYYITMMSLATGNMSKEQLADWLRTAVNVTPPDLYEK